MFEKKDKRGNAQAASGMRPVNTAQPAGKRAAGLPSGGRGSASAQFGPGMNAQGGAGAKGGASFGGAFAVGSHGAAQRAGGLFAEMVCDWLAKVRFRKKAFGGVDERDVWLKINELNELYERGLAAERARYDALLAAAAGPAARPAASQQQSQRPAGSAPGAALQPSFGNSSAAALVNMGTAPALGNPAATTPANAGAAAALGVPASGSSARPLQTPSASFALDGREAPASGQAASPTSHVVQAAAVAGRGGKGFRMPPDRRHRP